MTINALTGPNAHLYKQAIRKLQKGEVVSSDDFPNTDTYKSGTSKMVSVLNHLACPTSHNIRLQYQLTVWSGAGYNPQWTGAVVRVGKGRYRWDRDMILPDQHTLATFDAKIRRLNDARWLFSTPIPHTEDRVTDIPPPPAQPAVSSAPHVIKFDDDLLIVHYDGITYVCEIRAEVGG